MTHWLDRARWLPVDAPLKGSIPRSRGQLLAVVAQFDLEHTARYQRSLTSTWCNIFSWDCTRALGCEIPHWVSTNGDPCAVGKGGELSANLTFDWLKTHGPRFGWLQCGRSAAGVCAELGQPAVAAWRNPVRHWSGHIAVIVPAIEAGVMHIAQAGSRCFTSEPLVHGFGTTEPTFFTHP